MLRGRSTVTTPVHGVEHPQQLLLQCAAALDHLRQLLLRVRAHLQRVVTNDRAVANYGAVTNYGAVAYYGTGDVIEHIDAI